MAEPQPLAQLQQWMLGAIASPHGIDRIDELLLPGPQQSTRERLAVYQRAYGARLIDCLREFFPILAQTLGEGFDQFAAEYVERYPPASYTLNRLADHFVEHLVGTRPNLLSPDWPDFLIELARLEHAIAEVFEGPGIEDLPPLDVAQLASLAADELFETRLTPAPCLRLFEFQFTINDFYTAAKRGEWPTLPAPEATWLAITRREYVVRRVPLERAEFAVLSALASGQTFGETLVATDAHPDEVSRWFADWGQLGLFVGVSSVA